MNTMNCERCGKTFSKANYARHQKRRTPCKADTPEYIVKPILKWAGGKTQIISDIIERFPNVIDNYYEPFLGGGSVLLALLSCIKAGKIRLTGKIYASDLNENLVGVYQRIQKDVDGFIKELKELEETMRGSEGDIVRRDAKSLQEAMTSPESYYYWVRGQYNMTPRGPGAAAMFMYLNKTCFRGLYREGPNGFNVPFGHYRNPSILDERHIREVSELIRDVEFRVAHYTELMDIQRMDIQRMDFIYLDPPYVPEKQTSFVSYTVDGFNAAEHTRLFDVLQTVPCKFLLSNADVPFVRERFPESKYETIVIPCRRAINSKNPEAVTNEVLIRPVGAS
jgi:DNA adenine methylase